MQTEQPSSFGLNRPKVLLALGLLALSISSAIKLPTVALAVNNDWLHGFHHPLQGWDHLLTMIAVGVWAAQLHGKAVWLLPVTFVSIMSLGAMVGVVGISAPSVEIIILLSGLVLSVFVVRQVRFSTPTNVLVVAFFGFFHGYVHGQEISASASLLSYTIGFVFATLLLHGIGILATRLALVSLAFMVSGHANADQDSPASFDTKANLANNPAVNLDDLVVLGRANPQLGIADSASQGSVGQAQLNYRALGRPGEVLESVPGLIVTQHSGEGKANQYFLRGFNLDHGTDFLSQIDDMPINAVSHAHGQGYTDTNFLIPELIEKLDFKKGSSYAENGDFSSAGSANIHYFKTLPQSIFKFTGGSFDYYRGLAAASHQLANGNILVAGEVVFNNGPWTTASDYSKYNGVLAYSQELQNHGFSITAMATQSDWRSTDQIPERAIKQGRIGLFDALDPSDGGSIQRYSLTGEWHHHDANSETKLMAYGIYSKLKLYSDFTFFLDNNETTNPVGCQGLNTGILDASLFNSCGDQFGQPDQRYTSGFKASHTIFHKIGTAVTETSFGLQARNDNIQNALLLSHAQIPFAEIRRDSIWQSSLSPYVETKSQWLDWLRTSVGLRFDGFRFDVQSNRKQNSGERYDGLFSPKFGIAFGPWANTEFYVNAGLGYHSNDARGVNLRVDPGSGSSSAAGEPITRATPLVRTYSSEIGIRSTWLKGLQSTIAVWWLDMDSELVFLGDAGTTEASRPSRRYGLEFANYYAPTSWLDLDADFSFSHTRFRNQVAGTGQFIPNSVATVITAGASFHELTDGFFGGPRLRYFGSRALDESGDIQSQPTLILSALVGYKFNKNLSVQAEGFNLLNRKDANVTYYYASRLPGEPSPGVNDYVSHPIEPASVRLSISAKF